MNKKIYILGMVMSYLQVILEASMVCSWLPLVPLLIVLEKRERMVGCSFIALCLVSTALYYISNHENQLAKERCRLSWTCVPF